MIKNMTPADFAKKWERSEINRFKLSSPLAEGLSIASQSALKEYGLPSEAEPWLSFREFDQDDVEEFFPAGDATADYFPVGQLANGSLICIDKQTDQIVIIERDAPDDLWILNSSLEALYESLVIFDGFISEVNIRNPRYAIDYKIPEGMLTELKDRLTACDPEAMAAKGYWHCELGVLDDSSL